TGSRNRLRVDARRPLSLADRPPRGPLVSAARSQCGREDMATRGRTQVTALAQPGATPARTVLAVPGMHCAGCMGKVERGLAAVPGGPGARVNLSARTVAVTHTSEVEEPDLVEALADIGFEAQPRTESLAPRRSAVRPLLAPLAVAGF